MIILDSTTKSLQFFLGGTVATRQLPYTADYVDVSLATALPTYLPASQDGQSNDTTSVTMVSAPAAMIQREVGSPLYPKRLEMSA